MESLFSTFREVVSGEQGSGKYFEELDIGLIKHVWRKSCSQFIILCLNFLILCCEFPSTVLELCLYKSPLHLSVEFLSSGHCFKTCLVNLFVFVKKSLSKKDFLVDLSSSFVFSPFSFCFQAFVKNSRCAFTYALPVPSLK